VRIAFVKDSEKLCLVRYTQDAVTAPPFRAYMTKIEEFDRVNEDDVGTLFYKEFSEVENSNFEYPFYGCIVGHRLTCIRSATDPSQDISFCLPPTFD
jgi:hypothetical protein